MLSFMMIALMAGAGPQVQTPTVQDFTAIYDAYLAAVKTGSYAKVSPFFSREMKSQIKSAADQKEYMMMSAMMVPAKYEPEFLTFSNNGKKADLQIIVTINVPPEVQKEQKLPPTQRQEMILSFVFEQGAWKWDTPTFLGDPDQRARPKDLNMGTRADYKDDANTSMGGQILRVEKQSAGTVYVIRVVDEEDAIFVPKGTTKEEFVAGQIISIQAAAHKSDKLKYWAEEISLYQQ